MTDQTQQAAIREAPDTKEMQAVAALLAAMHENGLEGALVREAMAWAIHYGEPLVRYCPGCGSVGQVEANYRDCCPDGNEARLIPAKLAEKCRDTFKIAIRNITPAAPAVDAPVASGVLPLPAPAFELTWRDGAYRVSAPGLSAAKCYIADQMHEYAARCMLHAIPAPPAASLREQEDAARYRWLRDQRLGREKDKP